MKRIVTHPRNVEALRRQIEKAEEKNRRESGVPWASWPWFGVEVTPNPHMDAEKETGRYVLPDGRVVAREELRLSTRWIDYRPEDVDWLVYTGIVKAETEMVFYEIDDTMLRFSLQMNCGVAVTDRRAMFLPFL